MASHLIGQHQITTFTTPVNGTSPIDANQVRGNDNTTKTAYDAHDNDTTIHVQDSILGSRPAASTEGQKWLTTDAAALYLFYDTGTVWSEISYLRSTGGAITGPVSITSTTTPQLTVAYDGSNNVTLSVSSAGAVTLNATGASAGFTFSDAVTASAGLTSTTGTFTSTVLLSNAVQLQWKDTGGTARRVVDYDSGNNLNIGRAGAGNLGTVQVFADTALTFFDQAGVSRFSVSATTGAATFAGAASGITSLGMSSTLTNTGGAIVINSTGNAVFTANGATGSGAYTLYRINSVSLWETGMVTSGTKYDVYDVVNAVAAISITPGAAPAVAFAGALSGITTITAATVTATSAMNLNVPSGSANLVINGSNALGAYITYQNTNTQKWFVGRGIIAANNYEIYDATNGAMAIAITQGAAPAVAFNGALSGITTLTTTSHITAGASGQIGWTGRGGFLSISDASFRTSNNAGSDYGDLQIRALTCTTGTFAGAVTGVTTLAGTGAVSGFTSYTATSTNGAVFTATSATTGTSYFSLANTTGQMYLGLDNSAGGGIFTGGTAYAVILGTNAAKPIQFFTNNVLALTIASGGNLTAVGGFGCNTKAAQTAFVSGGALNAYGAGVNGLDSAANMSALHALVVNIRAALVANGIMS